jgi:hypothetical protein
MASADGRRGAGSGSGPGACSGAGARLRTKLELAAPVYAAAAARLWASPRTREVYPVYLATMHMVARASVPLLDAASERARALVDLDDCAAGLDAICRAAAVGRTGLAERILDDLAATGADRRIPLAAIPSPSVASLVGAQYYWVHHHHPIAVLGYLAALDIHPPSPGFAAAIRERTGFPDDAFRVAAAQERRGAVLLDQIDALPLSPRLETLLGVAALHTVDAGVEVLAEVYARVFERP